MQGRTSTGWTHWRHMACQGRSVWIMQKADTWSWGTRRRQRQHTANKAGVSTIILGGKPHNSKLALFVQEYLQQYELEREVQRALREAFAIPVPKQQPSAMGAVLPDLHGCGDYRAREPAADYLPGTTTGTVRDESAGDYDYCRGCVVPGLRPAPAHFILDSRTDELCCAACGLVQHEKAWLPVCNNSSGLYTRLPSAKSASGVVYKRAYHWNERLSQRQATDPRVPVVVLEAVRRWLACPAPAQLRAPITYYQYEQLDRATLHAALRQLGYKVYCERWHVGPGS